MSFQLTKLNTCERFSHAKCKWKENKRQFKNMMCFEEMLTMIKVIAVFDFSLHANFVFLVFTSCSMTCNKLFCCQRRQTVRLRCRRLPRSQIKAVMFWLSANWSTRGKKKKKKNCSAPCRNCLIWMYFGFSCRPVMDL